MAYLLLESGSRLLAEDGASALLLEGSTPAPAPAVVDAVRWTGDDVIAAVQSWWLGTPAMAALTSDGNLWHKVAPEDVQLPYATIFLASENAETWTTSYSFERSTIQINLHAATDRAARDMGRAVRAALGPAPGQPAGAVLVVGIQQVCHVLPDGHGIDIGEGLGPGGRDCWVAFETFDVPWTT